MIHCKSCRQEKEAAEFKENSKDYKTCNVCRVSRRRPTKCDVCEKIFTNPHGLNTHKKINCNPNEYEIKGDYVEIRLGKPNNGKGNELFNRNIRTKLDLDVFMSQKYLYTNTAICDDKYGYATITINRKGFRLHRFIMGNENELVIDHINHDIRDNRKSNLRYVTKAQNSMNMKKNIVNTTGYKGVSWNEAYKKYVSQIYLNRKRIFLGYFACKKEAHKAYITKALEIQGEFMYNCECDVCN